MSYQNHNMEWVEMGHALPRWGRNDFMKQSEMSNYRKKHNNKGIYRSAYLYDQVDNIKEAYLLSDFYMDFDNKEDIELAREDIKFVIWKMHLKTSFNLPIEAFRIYFSGMKGFHLTIPKEYMGIQPSVHLDDLFKWIAMGLNEESVYETIDLVVYERRRMWRLENSQHPETQLYKIPLQYKELQELSLDEIMELAKKPRVLTNYPEPQLIPEARKQYEKEARSMLTEKDRIAERMKNYTSSGSIFKEGEVPDYVQQILDEGPIDGYRNETAAALTSYFMQQKLTKEEVWNELLGWSKNEMDEGELKTTMESVFDKGYTYGRSRLKALAAKDLSKIGLQRPKGGEVPWKNTQT